MMYALIKNGTVANVVLADQSYIDYIKNEYDAIVPADYGVGIGTPWNEVDGFVHRVGEPTDPNVIEGEVISSTPNPSAIDAPKTKSV